MSPFVSISITVCRESIFHECIRWWAGRSQYLVSYAHHQLEWPWFRIFETSLISLSRPFSPISGCICDKMVGGSCCRRPTMRPTMVTASQWHYMELLEAHRIANQQPLSHRCEHRHPARHSEDKEDKVNEDQPHAIQTDVQGLAHSVGSIAIALL